MLGKMNLRYLGKTDDEDSKTISFWCDPIRYDFEIIYENDVDIEIFEQEFQLNCKKQLNNLSL